MSDPFAGAKSELDSPARRAIAVTPDNSNDMTLSARCLYIGVSGDVEVVTVDGDTVIFKAHPVGYMPVRVKRVRAAGTTATNILALI